MRCLRTVEVERARERDHFYQLDSTYVNQQGIVTPGENETSSHHP